MTEQSKWARAAIKILKTELSKRDLTYKDLTQKLNSMDVNETEGSIKVKLSRGTFSAIFFLQVLYALEIKNLIIDDIFFNENF